MTDERRKIRKPTMAAELNDDLILEIVKRLPLKCAVQCSVLNKNICHLISHQPNFFSHYSTILHCCDSVSRTFKSIWQPISSTRLHPLRKSITLDNMYVFIIASCNGLLLLKLFHKFHLDYYIFNPTTAAIMAVDRGKIEIYKSVGLAVPEDNSRFKLVALDVEPTRLVFTVLVPSGKSLRVKSRVDFECGGSFELVNSHEIRPVYAHGSLYWLGYAGRVTVAFDVEKEEARLIGGPIESTKVYKVVNWFGFADGAVHFIYASRLGIVIYCYDHFNCEWRLKHTMSNPIKNRYFNGKPLLFDGRRLLFAVFEDEQSEDAVYSNDLVGDLWEKIESVECIPFLFPYTSSFAEVSDTYLNEKNTSIWKHEVVRDTLLGFQTLLMPDTPMHIQKERRPKRITRRPKKFNDFVCIDL